MTDIKASLERDVALASAGALVLGNEAYKVVMMARKATLFDDFCKTTHAQASEREDIWRTMQNLIAIEREFEFMLATGKIAKDELNNYN